MSRQEFDYVVVGAGSSGAVIAARLSEDPSVTVALVEAGPTDVGVEDIAVPAATGGLLKSRYDWDFDSDTEDELGGRRMFLPRGRVLGGSSAINTMIYIRGSRDDYDEYAAAGAKGWGWDDVKPYFLRSEDNERGADDYHAVGGPLAVSDGRSNHPLCDAFVDAAVQSGLPRNVDFNGASQLGAGRLQMTQRHGLRASTAEAFLRPAQARPNLTVLTDALVHTVDIESGRAVGVTYSRGADLHTIRAAREVVVAGGAYGSPHLLLRSGIGPADQLRAFGLPVQADLPVGHNLQDHYMALLNYTTDQESLLSAATPQNAELLQREGRGPLTSNIAEAGAFAATRSGLSTPDVQFLSAPVLFFNEALGGASVHGYTIAALGLKPEATGQLSLRSTAPDAAPRIVHNYLGTHTDRDVLVEALRIALDFVRQPALQAVTTGVFHAPDADSDAALLAYGRRYGVTNFHPTSSCAIGPVVDAELRVHGIDGLRVADASVLPTVPRGNTNAPSIMVGEKAADLIRGR